MLWEIFDIVGNATLTPFRETTGVAVCLNFLGDKLNRSLFIRNPCPAQATSKHKHRFCPCPKWVDFVYSLIFDELTGLDARAGFCKI